MSVPRHRPSADKAQPEDMPRVLRVISLINWLSLAAVAAWVAVVVTSADTDLDAGSTQRLTAATAGWRTSR